MNTSSHSNPVSKTEPSYHLLPHYRYYHYCSSWWINNRILPPIRASHSRTSSHLPSPGRCARCGTGTESQLAIRIYRNPVVLLPYLHHNQNSQLMIKHLQQSSSNDCRTSIRKESVSDQPSTVIPYRTSLQFSPFASSTRNASPQSTNT